MFVLQLMLSYNVGHEQFCGILLTRTGTNLNISDGVKETHNLCNHSPQISIDICPISDGQIKGYYKAALSHL